MEQLGKFLGRYQLVRILGRGAMGVVYEGLDPKLGRQVAVKTILKSQMQDAHVAADYSARFIREAQAVARLNHPNIVTVFDFGNEADIAYLVMEFIRGKELKNYLDDKHLFGIAEAVAIVCDLLEALDYAHNNGIIHRDIKPANVMLDVNGRVKLTDFGVARLSDGASQEGTRAGTMVGTPSYMSPEQIQGMPSGPQADLFATGVLLYQCLTLQKPFTGNSEWEIWQKIVNADPPPLSRYRAAVPAALERALLKALAKDPKQRPATARALITELKLAMAGAAEFSLAFEPEPFDADATRIAGTAPPIRQDATLAALPALEASARTMIAPARMPEQTTQRNAVPEAGTSANVTVAEAGAGDVQRAPARSKMPLLAGGGVLAALLIGGAIVLLPKKDAPPVPAPAPSALVLPTVSTVPTVPAAAPAPLAAGAIQPAALPLKAMAESAVKADPAQKKAAAEPAARQLAPQDEAIKLAADLAAQKAKDQAKADLKRKEDKLQDDKNKEALLKTREAAEQKSRDEASARDALELKSREEAKLKEAAALKAKVKVDPEALLAQAQRSEKEGRAREAVDFYKQAYNAGNGRAARLLGDIYGRGSGDVGRDYGEQLQWYEKAKAMGVEIPTPGKRKY